MKHNRHKEPVDNASMEIDVAYTTRIATNCYLLWRSQTDDPVLLSRLSYRSKGFNLFLRSTMMMVWMRPQQSSSDVVIFTGGDAPITLYVVDDVDFLENSA